MRLWREKSGRLTAKLKLVLPERLLKGEDIRANQPAV
jgi:hypothetical protein